MNRKIILAAAALASLVASSPAAADFYWIKDGNGTLQKIYSGTLAGQIQPYMMPVDLAGMPFGTVSNPFAMKFGTGVTLPSFAVPQHVICDSGCSGGSGGGGAVFGPTAVGSAAANPPILVGGTADGTATGAVSVLKVLGGSAFINCANCSGSGISVGFGGAIGGVGTPGGFKDGSGNFQPFLGDVTNGQWVNIKASATIPVSLTSTTITGSVAVTGTFWQATQPVSIASSVAVTGPLTDTQLRATAVPVSIGGTVPVSGTFWPYTLGQQLNAASVPVVLTAAQLTTLTPPAAITGFATQTTLASILTNLGSPFQAGASIGNTAFGISGTLPAYAATPTFNLGTLNGAATATLQGTGNTSLGSIDTKTPALGQALAAASVPVVLTAAQLSTLTPLSTVTVTQGTGSNLHVVCDSGCSGSGGTSSTFGATFPTAGTASGMSQGGNMVALTGTSGNLNVQCANCSGSGVSTADGAAFTAGSSLFVSAGGIYQTSATTSPMTNGQQGLFQMTINRAQHINLRNASGTELGVAAAPLQVSLANTAANGTALLVTGTGGTFPVTGTVTANAGTNLNTSALALETGGNLASIVTQLGAVTASPTANTISDRLKVINTTLGTPFQAGGSIGNTTFASTQSGAWNITNITGTITLPALASTSTKQSDGSQKTQIVDGSGNVIASTTNALNVNCANCSGGSNASVSATAAAVPASATYAGMNVSGNLVGLTGTANGLKVDGSAVTQPVSGTFWQATQPVSLTSTTITGTVAVTQSGAWSLTANQSVNISQINGVTPLMGNGVTGTGSQRVTIASDNTAFSVNATVTQATSSNLKAQVDPLTAASWGIGTATQNSASVANGHLILGQFNTTPTTITSGNMSPFQLDNAGNLLVNIKAGASSGAVAQASTTSGQTGGLTQAAVTTSAPTYTTATTNPLSMDTAGNLRVTVAAAVGLAQGSTTSGQTGSMVMGAVTTASPTYTTAQTSPLSLDTSGSLRINCVTGCGGGSGGTASNFGSAFPTSGTAIGLTNGTNMVAWSASSNYGTSPGAIAVPAVNASITNTVAVTLASTTITGSVAVTNAGTFAVQAASATAPVSTMNSASANAGLNVANALVFDDVTPTAITENSFGFQRMSANRNAYTTLRDAAGNERGANVTAANALSIDNSSVAGTAVAVNSGALSAGVQRVTLATDSTAIANKGEGATGATAPTGAQLAGAQSGANMVALIQASASVPINVSTATTTQLVALSGSTKVYVSSFDVVAGGTGNITFVYGTGTNCGTGQAILTGAYNLTAQAGIAKGNGLGPVLVVPAGNALCVLTTAAVQMSGSVSYTQF